MNLGPTLVRLRTARNLSQESLAEAVGVSRQAVSQWETGAVPDLENLVALARFFGTTVDGLVAGPCDAGPPLVPTPGPATGPGTLVPFLLKAKLATYAGHGAETTPCRPSSHDLTHADGEWCYYDTYLGGERFSGQEAVWHRGAPVWAMNYTGRLVADGFSGDFLKEALLLVGADAPFRGPRVHRHGQFTYHCRWSGDVDWFAGDEEIFFGPEKVYECLFHGGLVR